MHSSQNSVLMKVFVEVKLTFQLRNLKAVVSISPGCDENVRYRSIAV